MGSTSDKIKGYANEAAGSVKQTVGKATGSEELEMKGAAQKLKGEAQVGELARRKPRLKTAPTKLPMKSTASFNCKIANGPVAIASLLSDYALQNFRKGRVQWMELFIWSASSWLSWRYLVFRAALTSSEK